MQQKIYVGKIQQIQQNHKSFITEDKMETSILQFVPLFISIYIIDESTSTIEC